jgi:hypothetical protein
MLRTWKQEDMNENINPLTPKLNPSAQCCLTRFFTGDFPSWTVHFVNICVKNPINTPIIHSVYYLCMVAPTCFVITFPSSGNFLVPSERCSIEEQSKEYCGWACCVQWRGACAPQHAHPQYSIKFSSTEHLSEDTRNAPCGWQCNAETCRSYHT